MSATPTTPSEWGRVDLHTHSHHSDGVLAPQALVALAAQRKVEVLALTDHDTVAGCEAALAGCRAAGIGYVTGIELTCGWRGREIHVVGLGVDPGAASLTGQIAATLALRRVRIETIGTRLERVPALAGADLAARVFAQGGAPTRMHLARLLVADGHASSPQEAFDRFLKRGKAGHAPAEWPALETIVQCIRASGGLAVLAHPQRYALGSTALDELVRDFRAAGGAALEVSLPGMSPTDAARVASLARRHELAGSIGSDFHEPGLPWRPLGRFAKLPDRVEPLLPRLSPL